MKYRSSVFAAIVFATVSAFMTPAHATLLTNGDFSAEFGGWSGQVGDAFFAGLTDIPVLPGAFAANYDASSGAGQIQTSLSDSTFDVVLNQNVDLGSQAAGTALELSFDLVALGAPEGLFGAAFRHGCDALFDVCTDTILLLTSTASAPGSFVFDVSAAAGSRAQLTFNVSGFLEDAMMTVDNASLVAAAVSEPLIGGLLAIAMMLVVRRRA